MGSYVTSQPEELSVVATPWNLLIEKLFERFRPPELAMAGKKWLSGHLPVWQMARVCVRLCVSSEHSERVAILDAWEKIRQIQ